MSQKLLAYLTALVCFYDLIFFVLCTHASFAWTKHAQLHSNNFEYWWPERTLLCPLTQFNPSWSQYGELKQPRKFIENLIFCLCGIWNTSRSFNEIKRFCLEDKRRLRFLLYDVHVIHQNPIQGLIAKPGDGTNVTRLLVI